MNHLSFLVPIASWLLARSLQTATSTAKWLSQRAWLLFLLVALSNPTAHAGWFTRAPDPKTEAANRALEHAAQIATEAARTQSSQQLQLLQAVEALSNERTHLAAHLEQLGTLASRDSVWAAAIQAVTPVLVAVAVMALGAASVWMITRAGNEDSHVAGLLVEEIIGSGTGLLVGKFDQPRLRADAPADVDPSIRSLAHAAAELSHHPESQEGRMPF